MRLKGRFPYLATRVGTSETTAEAKISDDVVTIRVDDGGKLDFWLEFTIDRAEIEDWLRKMRDAE